MRYIIDVDIHELRQGKRDRYIDMYVCRFKYRERDKEREK